MLPLITESALRPAYCAARGSARPRKPIPFDPAIPQFHRLRLSVKRCRSYLLLLTGLITLYHRKSPVSMGKAVGNRNPSIEKINASQGRLFYLFRKYLFLPIAFRFSEIRIQPPFQFSAEIVQRDGISHCLLSQGSEMGSVRCIFALQF